MKRLADYVMVIDDVFDSEFCQECIDWFDSNDKNLVENEWDQGFRSFNEINMAQQEWFTERYIPRMNDVHKFYREKCNIDFFPLEWGFEEPRMKKYLNNNHDQFGWHVDVGDYQSARRYLVFLTYLNTVEEGGETIFDDKVNEETNLKVPAKQGRVVAFPPMWMYPHKGSMPISGNKYIVSTYGHYR